MSIWPPIVMLLFMMLNFAISLAKAGESRGAFNPLLNLLDAAALAAILYWGGFFQPLLR